MARDITFDVLTRHDDRGLRNAADGLDKLATKADTADDAMGDMSRSASHLEAQIRDTRAEIERLGDEFDRTGDRTLFGDIRKQQATLSNLERIKKALHDIADDSGGAGVLDVPDPGRLGRSIGPVIGTGVVAGLTPFLPLLGAMIAGTVAGAVGTGGIAGGILMASRDPRVRFAAARFGDIVTEEFFRGGEAFVGPVIRSLDILKHGIGDMKLAESFERMVPHVETIARGFADLGRNIMPGLNKAFDNMGPFAVVAAKGLGDLGTSLGDFMANVSESEGAVMGLETAFRLLNGTINLLGGGLQILSELYEGFARSQAPLWRVIQITADMLGQDVLAGQAKVMADAFDEMILRADATATGIQGVGDAAGFAGPKTQFFGEAAGLAASATGALAVALSDAHREFLDWAGAEINAEEAIDRFTDSVRENGRTLDVDTEAGRENVLGLKRIAETAIEATQAKYNEEQSVGDATVVYESYRKKLFDTLVALGYSKDAAQALVDKWLALAALPDITKRVTVRYTTIGQPTRTFGGGFFEGFQHGGTTPAFRPFVVGEREPELMFSDRQHFVATKQMMASGQGQASPPMDPRLFEYTGSNRFEADLIEAIRTAVQARGGTLAVLGLRTTG